MRAPKLVQHMKSNADRMSEKLMQKIRASEKCSELLQRVPVEEHKRYTLTVAHDLVDWLGAETDAVIEARYVALGSRRAQQGVSFRQVFWAVCITRDFLWDYIQQECLIEDPVEFWGGVSLLRGVDQFFDRALYFVLQGYEQAGKAGFAEASAIPA